VTNRNDAPRVVCFIEARMRSTRLPGKVMLPILGRPMIVHMVDRLREARLIEDVVIATTDHESCDPIAVMCEERGISCFRGSEDDVLARVLGAARAFDADVIVETTGDCPLHDARLIDKAVADFLLGGTGFVTNIAPYSSPRGTDVRIFTTEALAEVARVSDDPADHEHVSLYFMERHDEFRHRNVVTELGEDAPGYRLTVDTPEDFALVKIVFEALYPANPRFTLTDVLAYLRANPDVARINAEISQKAIR
jgi:spore coat polysaccharide biosynthesis protein SpsF